MVIKSGFESVFSKTHLCIQTYVCDGLLSSVVTVAWYTRDLTKHFPFMGHRFLFPQLHVFSSLVLV